MHKWFFICHECTNDFLIDNECMSFFIGHECKNFICHEYTNLFIHEWTSDFFIGHECTNDFLIDHECTNVLLYATNAWMIFKLFFILNDYLDDFKNYYDLIFVYLLEKLKTFLHSRQHKKTFVHSWQIRTNCVFVATNHPKNRWVFI